MLENPELYIAQNFEKALTEGHICAFFQPVVRTISRKLCSFEALARWIDPVEGIIGPDIFIPVLENSRKIHLLDRHIIRFVCARIRREIDAGKSPVPVSINLSRLDFTLCNIYKEVDEAVSRYKIPHDMLNIEITESVMASEEASMLTAVNSFRADGYQVWMDDFGSGYSSLNALKDFSFDELKLDMRFLSSFSERSRRIMTSVIQMAKEIDIHTLAEGVETEEQFRYLRDIGCEKVQGYYFGRPMQYDDAMAHLREQDIVPEEPGERAYYDEIGRLNFLSAVPFMTNEDRAALTSARQLNSIPLALAEGREDGFAILFYNSAFEETARSTGVSGGFLSEELLNVRQPYSKLPTRLINLMDSTRVVGDGRMYFIADGEYYEMRSRLIAKSKKAWSVLFRLDNLSEASEAAKTHELDDGLRQLYTLFERVTLVDTNEDKITPLYVATRENLLSGTMGVKDLSEEYARSLVFPEDRERYLAFVDPDTSDERIVNSSRTYISDFFRIYSRHGEYRWKQITILRMEERVYLELIRDAHDEIKSVESGKAKGTAQSALSDEVLWRNLVESGILRCFWKDKERRFVGISRGFADYYGIEYPEEIIGKTDEEMRWHIRPDPYMNDEWSVIKEGAVTHNVPGKCLCNGENRDILASKAPIYDRNGEIQGLIGWFIDRDMLMKNDSRGAEPKRRDMITGLLNSRGISEEEKAFQDEYYLRNADFVRIHVAIDDFSVINRNYGYDFGDKVIAELGKELKRSFGLKAAVGRHSGQHFVILAQLPEPGDGSFIRERIRECAAKIKKVGGVPLTLYVSVGWALYSECEDLDEQQQRAEMRLLADHTEHMSVESLVSRASELFSIYDDLPISYAVYKVVKDRKGKVVDAILFYVNHKFEERSGKRAVELLGKTTRELFPTLGESWYDKAERAAEKGETVIDGMYFEPTKKRYYMTVSPVIRTGYCCFTYQEIDLLDT